MVEFKTPAWHRAKIKSNQRHGVANTLRAGNKLTAAQKKNFSASEIAAIRGELEKETPLQKRMRKPAGIASKNVKGGGQRLRKTFGTKSVYSGKTTSAPTRARGKTGTGKGKAAVAAYKKKKATPKRITYGGQDIKRRRGT